MKYNSVKAISPSSKSTLEYFDDKNEEPTIDDLLDLKK